MNDLFSNKKVFLMVNLISVGLLLGALADNPYDYYVLLRVLLSFIFGINIIFLYKIDNVLFISLFALFLILYNPLLPIRMHKSTWGVINIITVVFISLSTLLNIKKIN